VTAAVLLAPSTTPAAAAPARVPGIDVSKWQGDVDWTAVSDTNLRFVIIRSTIGDWTEHPFLEVDPRYVGYVDGATTNGLVVGAYHRANVDRTEGDAVEEADFFVDEARIEAGDVLPALDIEQPHDLSVEELRTWVRTWVQRVHARTGVKPLIYSGPYFWRTYLGDSTWFANHGYPLWLAHWGVSEPDVPAEDWGGHGWTYWQWNVTDPGSVPGIATDIDRDRFSGSDLVGGTIASLSVTPAAAGTIVGPRIRCGGSFTRCSRLGNRGTTVTVEAVPDAGAVLMGWTGACAGAGTAATCNVPLLGAKHVSAIFGFPLTVEEDGPGTSYTWGRAADPLAIGGSYRREKRLDAEVAFDVSGGVVTLWTIAGADRGRARVVVDGTIVDTIDGYAPSEERRSYRFDGLGPGAHEFRVVVLGSERPASRGKWVAIDALRWGGVTRPDPAGRAAWGRHEGEAISAISDVAGATARLRFTGSGVMVRLARGPSMGKAELRIDGTTVRVVDLYATEPGYRTVEIAEGLVDGQHTATVVVLGIHRPASRHDAVAVDGWLVI
jgi:GH25 family lysozyme M1 (1,4-beta-N-acetylmuramidase)